MSEGSPPPEEPTPPDETRLEMTLMWGRIKAWLWLMGALAIAFAVARLTGFL